MMPLPNFLNCRTLVSAAILFLMTVFFAGLYSISANAQNNVLAQQLLAKMSQSVRELDYQGSFTFEVPDSAIESYQLTHVVIDGRELEKLEKLNGSSKEVIRQTGSASCLAVGDKILQGRLKGIHPSDQLFNNYTLYLRGEQRIAGRVGYLLQLVPHDSFRYGHSIVVDKETFLPLQKQWFSADNKLMERMQFVGLNLSIEEKVASNIRNMNPATAFEARANQCGQEEEDLVRASWTVNWLPKGFFLTHVGRTDEGESMLSYTDGLASFSIFVQDQPVKVLLEGKSVRGATVAYVGNRIWNKIPYRITVVGEIPTLSAQKVIASLEPLNE